MDLATKKGIYVYSGLEMMMNIDFLDWLDRGIYQTLNESRYMLIEFRLGQDIHYLSYINEYLEEVLCRGMISVIAHVERFSQ